MISIGYLKLKLLVCKFFTRFSPSQEIFINSSFDFFLMFLIVRIVSTSAYYILSYYTSFRVELNILGFLFSYHNWFIKSKVNGSYDFFLTRLKESIFYIRKGDIYYLIFDVGIPETVKVALKISLCFFLTYARTCIQISQNRSFSFVQINFFLFDYILFCMFFT